MDKETMCRHGVFGWNELLTRDVAGAKAFYGELLGWELHDKETPMGTYTFIMSGDEQLGGMMAMPPGCDEAPNYWGAYVTVDDVDARAARVEQLGGKIVMGPEDVPGIGRFIVLQDPQGAVLGLATYTME